jgi:hypothetical protein
MRTYKVGLAFTSGVSTPAQCDFFELTAGAGRPIVFLGWEFGQTSEVGDLGEEELELVFKRLTTVTSGSGGTAAGTIRPIKPNDVGSTATIENGNTTKATGTTTHELGRFVWNVRMAHLYVPIPEERETAAAGEALVLELAQTPLDAITKVAGVLKFAELV